MADKVQLIKEEIERLKEHTAKCGYPGQGEFENGNREGRNWVCDKLLSFIDSLPEEPASEELEKEIKRYINEEVIVTSENVVISKHHEFHNFYVENLVDVARHFAEWQKQKDMQDFLEKAIIAYCEVCKMPNCVMQKQKEICPYLSKFRRCLKSLLNN